VEAERALLGGLLERPDLQGTITELLRADDFYRHDHQALFQLIADMAGRGEHADMVTVPMRVAQDENPDRFGGVQYVTELPQHAPATANLPHYASVVKHKAKLRALIAAAEVVAHDAHGQPDDVASLIEKAAKAFADLGADGDGDIWHQVSEIIDDRIVKLEQLSEQPDAVTGVKTGFVELDDKLAGMQPGDLLILAARPSMGKTALALNIAQNAAMMSGVGVAIYSLEMGRDQLVDRMLCTLALVNASKVRTGNLDVEDWARLIDASEVLRQAQVHINDRPGLTVAQVRAHARQLKARHPSIGLIMLDYLQLMSAVDPRQSRVQQVSDMSRGLKALAKDLGVPVLALSQLSRGVEQRQDKRPIMSDLRESGAIEQDADVIMFIYRDEYYNKETTDSPGLAEVIIAKQRNGPTGVVKLRFQGAYTRFDDALEDELRI
jgi:replicative DNA helicase